MLSHVIVSRTHFQEPIAAEDAHVRQVAVQPLVVHESFLLQTIWIDHNIAHDAVMSPECRVQFNLITHKEPAMQRDEGRGERQRHF